MTSWRLLASPEPDRRIVAAVFGAHLLATLLPWLLPLPAVIAMVLSLVALLSWPCSRRCLPRVGRLQGLELDPQACSVRLADGWWPARLQPGCRVYRDVALLRVRSAAGTVVALIGRDGLDAADFRRLKCLLRARDGAGGRLC